MAKMTLKKAESLYKKAHKSLTPAEEEDAHRAEKLLKKKGIEAEREDGKFVFSKNKKKIEEELVGKQNKIDVNKNGKIDSHDFKLLRKLKNKLPSRPNYKGSGEVNWRGEPIVDESPMSNVDWAKHIAGTAKDIIKSKFSKKKQQSEPEIEGIPF